MNPLAKAGARRLIDYYSIKAPNDIDIEAIASGQRAFVKEKPMSNADGLIIHNQNGGIIVVNSNITYQPQRRFIIAHELGHFTLHNKDKFFNCNSESFLDWHTNFSKEAEANEFAAELLMPEEIFKGFSIGKMISTDLVSELAHNFNTSFTSTAFRYAEIGNHPTAIVYCKDGVVKWSKINADFKYKYIENGRKIPSNSYTHDFFQGNLVPQTPEEIPLDVWFENSFDFEPDKYIFEQIHTFPKYNSVLVLLWEI